MSVKHRVQRLNALDLEQNELFNDQVDAIFSEQAPFVVGGGANLSCALQSDVVELYAQR